MRPLKWLKHRIETTPYGLVLEGGGAKGSYEIGVYQALRELKINLTAVTGTSVGALNGAMVAQGRFQDAYDLWYNMHPGLVINGDTKTYEELINFKLNLKGSDKYYEFVRNIIREGGLDIQPLKALIQQYANEEKVRASDMDFGLVTVSLSDLKPIQVFKEDIPQGKLHEYLLASAYLPGFKPEQLSGKRYVDGGLYDNAPINLIAQKGVRNVIVVRLHALGFTKSVKDKTLNIIEINPTGELGSILDFNKEKMRENLKMGYYDTLRVYGKVEGEQYCFTNLPDEQYFVNRLYNLENTAILEMAKEMGVKAGDPKRTQYEEIIPELAHLCDCGLECSYKDMFVAILEAVAEIYEVDRFAKYEYQDFLQLLREQAEDQDKRRGIIDRVPRLLRRSHLVQSSFKQRLLLKWAEVWGILPKKVVEEQTSQLK